MEHAVIMAEAKAQKEVHADDRSYVDRMFKDFNPETGKSTTLPVRVQNGSKLSKITEIAIEPNTIPVIMDFGKEVPDFVEMNGLKQGATIVMIGGQRQAKASLGNIRVPLSEIDAFCENVIALRNALNTKLPEILKKAEYNQ